MSARAERRRQQRETAKAEKLIEQQRGVAKRIAPGLEAKLTEAREDAMSKGWSDVAEAWQEALASLDADAGLALQDAVERAAQLIDRHASG